jgi:hypothetical protein
MIFATPWVLLNFNTINVALNIMKPPWCNPPHQGLSNNTKSMVGGTMVWEIST